MSEDLARGDDRLIIIGLREWWGRHSQSKNKWRTPVGRQIRVIVEFAGNWRNAPRGNPAKGFRMGFGRVMNEVE